MAWHSLICCIFISMCYLLFILFILLAFLLEMQMLVGVAILSILCYGGSMGLRLVWRAVFVSSGVFSRGRGRERLVVVVGAIVLGFFGCLGFFSCMGYSLRCFQCLSKCFVFLARIQHSRL